MQRVWQRADGDNAREAITVGCKSASQVIVKPWYDVLVRAASPNQVLTHAARAAAFNSGGRAKGSGQSIARLVGLQPTVITSRAPHLLLEQSVRLKESWTCIARASPVNARLEAKLI